MSKTLEWPAALRPLVTELWADIEASADRRAREEAKADPVKHKLSRRFESSAAYSYWKAGRDGRGREVRFCWSSHRNIAGYFLTWREVVGKRGGKRDQWSARKTRTACRAMAERRRDSWQARAEVEARAKIEREGCELLAREVAAEEARS